MDSNIIVSKGNHYLEKIRQEIYTNSLKPTNTNRLKANWSNHMSQVRQRLPEAVVKAEGQILHTGELSPGCRACKAGAWDCVFITNKCNLTCRFCTQPLISAGDRHGAAFGLTPEEFIENIAKTTIRGVGFTGGEALSQPKRLYRWIEAIKKAQPDIYLWVYTNGLLATQDRLKALQKSGVDEIRFNMAATGYDHPQVLAHLEQAARLFQAVAIEIPAVPDDALSLQNSLVLWASAGATYLNLHELMREPNSNSMQLSGDFFTWITPDGHHTDLHLKSRLLVLKIMETVINEKIPLWVNDCSSQSKIRQIVGRRRLLQPLVKQPFEKYENNHFLSHICALSRTETALLIHPDRLLTGDHLLRDHKLYRIQRAVPLSVFELPRWIKISRCLNDFKHNNLKYVGAFFEP